jgi:hypothetical protein
MLTQSSTHGLPAALSELRQAQRVLYQKHGELLRAIEYGASDQERLRAEVLARSEAIREILADLEQSFRIKL